MIRWHLQQVFGVWLFLNPILGAGIAGLKAGPLAPLASLAKHLAFGLVVAWLYPVATASPTGPEGAPSVPRPRVPTWLRPGRRA